VNYLVCSTLIYLARPVCSKSILAVFSSQVALHFHTCCALQSFICNTLSSSEVSRRQQSIFYLKQDFSAFHPETIQPCLYQQKRKILAPEVVVTSKVPPAPMRCRWYLPPHTQHQSALQTTSKQPHPEPRRAAQPVAAAAQESHRL
jgi:hypothetical protein